MKKAWITFICLFLCVLIPFGTVAAIGFGLPSQFGNTFLGELENKIDRLYSLDKPKIVVIGGSSVPFGVDSKLMEKALGMPTVNFGLYATLGTKMMLDISKGAIKKGDIIVIAPETDAQTYSMFFNSESAWQACDSDFSILRKMSPDSIFPMLGGFWKYSAQKLKYYRADSPLDPAGVYNKKSFDEYGDIVFSRPYNIMQGDYDSSSVIKFTKDIVSPDFIAYVNDYIKYAEKKGATVYFSFAPANEDAIDPDTTLESLEEFTKFISDSFNCKVISDPNSYIYPNGYFYDSNFHMNDAGTVLHTATLVNDLAAAMGKEPAIDIKVPDAPEKPKEDDYDVSYDENSKYFVYEENKAGYIITGMTEEGKKLSSVTTPRAYEGKRVVSVARGAFDGSSAVDIYITTGITQLADGAFAGATALKRVHILATDPNNTTVNNVTGGLTDGMAKGAVFCVPKGCAGEFSSNYFWGPYADYITEE